MTTHNESFCRRAARVLGGAYFNDPEDIIHRFAGDEARMVKEADKRFAERQELTKAIEKASSLDDLSPAMRSLFDRVKRYDATLRDAGDRLNDTGFSIGISKEASELITPSPEDAHLLAAAMMQAKLHNNDATVKRLAQLAHTPWKIHEALGHGGNIHDMTIGEEEQKLSLLNRLAQGAADVDHAPFVKPYHRVEAGDYLLNLSTLTQRNKIYQERIRKVFQAAGVSLPGE